MSQSLATPLHTVIATSGGGTFVARETAGSGGLEEFTAGEFRTLLGLGAAALSDGSDFAAAIHTHVISDVTNLATSLAAKADLVGGVLPTSQLPAVAVTEYLGTVASQTAMLALTGQKGDWAIRTDTGSTWIITGDDPTQLADWTELSYPAAPVTSVNSQTGTVVLALADLDTSVTGAQLDSLKTKVDGIESGATADQSDAEIETAYNNQVAVVSQAIAEAGTSTTVYRWTPERVAQAITALGSSGGNSFETIIIKVAGTTIDSVVADSSTDTLTIDADCGMSVSVNAGADTITLDAVGLWQAPYLTDADIYYTPLCSATTNLATTANRIYLAQILIPKRITISTVTISVVSAVASTQVRLGLYDRNPTTNQPTDLLADFGVIDTSTSGSKSITGLSLTLNPGVYWQAIATDGAPNLRAMAFGSTPNVIGMKLNSATPNPTTLLFRSFTFGALPADESAQTYTPGSNQAPFFGMRD